MKFTIFLLPATAVSFSVQPLLARRSSVSTQLDAVGIFFGTSTGNTESAAEVIAETFGADASEPIDIDTIQGSLADEFAKYDALVVGTPTWNTGAETERSGTGWDEVYYGEMQDLKLQGKNVAVFGLGDSVSYSENYADGTGELHDIFQNLGCNMLGYVSQEGYEYDESKAARGDKFCGLCLDNVNFEDLTEERVQNWVAQLKEEGITGGASAPAVEPAAAAVEPLVAAAAAAVETPVADDATAAIIAQLEKENAALRQQLEESANMPAIDGADGYAPHYNSITGRTMWTSGDGRTCYYTEASTKVSP